MSYILVGFVGLIVGGTTLPKMYSNAIAGITEYDDYWLVYRQSSISHGDGIHTGD